MRSISMALFLAIFSFETLALEYEGKYLNHAMTQQFDAWKRSNQTVNGVYLVGTAWIAHAGRDVRCSSSGSLQQICTEMTQISSAGGVVLDMAQAPSGEFIILSTNGAFYSHRDYFESLGIVAAINQFAQAQKRVNSVALFEGGGWLLIAQGEVRSRSLPRSLNTALSEARMGEHYLTRIVSKFVNANETHWLLSAQSDYWTNRTDADLQAVLHRYIKDNYYLGPVFIDGPRFVATANHKRFATKPVDRFETDIRDATSGVASHILQRMEHFQVPGVTIAIINGDTITTRTYGVLNNSTKLKARTTSYYPSASLSKAVFSYGMLRAHERGVLNLDQTVHNFAQAYPRGLVRKWVDSLPSTREQPYEHRSKVMTLRSLLSHSGGTSIHGIGVYSRTQMRTLSDLIMGTNGRSKTNPIDFPGLSIRYSGGGYSLLEAALEDATGQSASEWLALNVLVPLKMVDSTFSYLHPSREINMARGHGANGRPHNVVYCPGKGAGGLITNAHDYAKFLWSVMNEAKIYSTSQRYLNKASHQQVFTPAHSTNSSMQACSSTNPCHNAREICSLNRCLFPARDTVWFRHHGPGQMHSTSRVIVQELNQTLFYPQFTEHGGSQAGIRTRFEYRYAQKKGIVILTNADGKWTDSNSVDKGADLLINELLSAFYRHW
jgi:CubicO group peptidase (beta-lactamase class C family)